MTELTRDMTLEVDDLVEYFDYGQWHPGVIVEIDEGDTNYPYQIRDNTGYSFWGYSAEGVRRRLDEAPVEADAPVPDMVNEPPHYNSHPKGIECIEVIEDNPFLTLGNAMKYLWRVSWGGKGNDEEDLRKAIWYIERELQRRGH